MIKHILFDLDGTLLPMDIDAFVKEYFGALTKYFAQLQYPAEVMLKGLMTGTKAMLENDGKDTNEMVFWKHFTQVSGYEKEEIEPYFLDFYKTVFPTLKPENASHETMQKAILRLKEKGYKLYLTTNPLFPRMAVEERLRWCQGNSDDFEAITSFETCHYTKPNPAYFKEFLEMYQLDPKECLMVGNDPQEDGVIESIDVPLYLVEDYKIARQDEIQATYCGSSEDFYNFVSQLRDLSGCK